MTQCINGADTDRAPPLPPFLRVFASAQLPLLRVAALCFDKPVIPDGPSASRRPRGGVMTDSGAILSDECAEGRHGLPRARRFGDPTADDDVRWPLRLHLRAGKSSSPVGAPPSRGDLVRPGGTVPSLVQGRRRRAHCLREWRDKSDYSVANGVSVPQHGRRPPTHPHRDECRPWPGP